MHTLVQNIASDLNLKSQQVAKAISLLDEGCSVPFIARYRKEITGALTDTELRNLQQRLIYLRQLMQRREFIMSSIEEQGKLTNTLKVALEKASTKSELEDLYLPYKPKRRTKGQIAIEAGLLPLAQTLLTHPETHPETVAMDYLNADKNISSCEDALDGARYILMEQFAEDAELLHKVRYHLKHHAYIHSQVITGKEAQAIKFKDYFDFSEKLNAIPSHRLLAVFRGRNEGFLQVSIKSCKDELVDEKKLSPCINMIADHFNIPLTSKPASSWLNKTVQWCWKIKILLHLESELFSEMKEKADDEAILVFSNNLRSLLMAAPAGKKVTMGLDPGLRTGVKVVVVDDTGKLLLFSTIFPHVPQKAWDQSLHKLKQYCDEFKVDLISIGNGTGSRETDKLVTELIHRCKDRHIEKMVVSEAGASIYSASEFAAKEFPDLDVTYRGAVSIARRLQDPMAELVKIDPKSIGVGQYQHDVSQVKLSNSLDAVVEDCVNSVGVNLNTASVPLLSRISGLSQLLAESIVEYREKNGAFHNRQQLINVPRLGPKAFEQSAGFLKIPDSENPLDNSTVHPESYALVNNMLAKSSLSLGSIVGNKAEIRKIKAENFIDNQFGLITIQDILKELEKPGRDPRPAFKTAVFKEGVEKIQDLHEGMRLEGVVSNVTNFGAFVDIGVHQDGLVHISMMSDQFVNKPSDILKTGDIVHVRVVEVDISRNRIALSMKSAQSEDTAPENRTQKPIKSTPNKQFRPKNSKKHPMNSANSTAMAMALSKALNKG